MTLFVSQFPIAMVCRIWDAFLVEGILFILFMACQIVLDCSESIIQQDSIEGVHKALTGFKNTSVLIETDKCIARALKL